MLSQFKMNPDPAYQNRLLPERDNASFFDGYSVWFYKEQGDLQQALHSCRRMRKLLFPSIETTALDIHGFTYKFYWKFSGKL